MDGHGAAEGWPGFWGFQGPEYLAWLGEQPERDHTILMGANTYRLMSGFAAQVPALDRSRPGDRACNRGVPASRAGQFRTRFRTSPQPDPARR